VFVWETMSCCFAFHPVVFLCAGLEAEADLVALTPVAG
jgi:hypothetical protein